MAISEQTNNKNILSYNVLKHIALKHIVLKVKQIYAFKDHRAVIGIISAQ